MYKLSYSNLYTNKLHLADVCLPITASFMENVANRNQLYRDLLKDKLNVNRRMFFENMIAQDLVMTGHGLTYAKFEHEESTQLQEVDFVIADGTGSSRWSPSQDIRPFTDPLTAS